MDENVGSRLRLKTIKMAGFKSFVDPTVVKLPSSLLAVVGPNGCGKSNIIDAVKVVMGESSAKQLRGESIADMIFNGSSARKPVGQAQVELIFDNSSGALGGEYASYSEIALRRVITRDGQSNYYLNNTRCRRRDIVDVFLGTGLGPRSYSIIGQGTISRIIEAKPEEMRIFIEEAAGISKYKERRKETERRIGHTRDNLDRVNDLREELEKQLQHLQRQAKAAERFRELKQEEREVHSQLLALRWQSLEAAAENFQAKVRKLEVELQGKQTEQQSVDTEIERLRDKYTNENDAYNDIQKRFYDAGANVARLEQTLQHQREKIQQLHDDLLSVKQLTEEAQSQANEDDLRVVELRQQQAELGDINPLEQQSQQTQQKLLIAEEKLQEWQLEWDEFNKNAAQVAQQAEVGQTRIQHLEQGREQAEKHIAKLNAELQQLSNQSTDQNVSNLQRELTDLQKQVEQQQQQLQKSKQQVQQQRETIEAAQQQLHKQQGELQQANGRFASLSTLQQAALGQDNQVTNQWLTKHQWQDKPRLAQSLQVEKGWEQAVETILSPYLQAVCLDELNMLTSALSGMGKGQVCFVSNEQVAVDDGKLPLSKLLEKIQGPAALTNLLAGIYIADNLHEAMQHQSQLQAHESIITMDGIWIGHSWLWVNKQDDPKIGTLQRKQELEQLQETISASEKNIAELNEQILTEKQELTALEQQCDEQEKLANQYHQQLVERQAQLRIQENRIEQVNLRSTQIQQEMADYQREIETGIGQLKNVRDQWQQAMSLLEQQANDREELESRKNELREHNSLVKQQAEQAKEHWQQAQIKQQTLLTEIAAKQQQASRIQQQLLQLADQKNRLLSALAETQQPLEPIEKELEDYLEKRVIIEEELTIAKQSVQNIEHAIREQDSKRHILEEQIAGIRSKLEQAKMDAQTQLVRQTTIKEQLEELNCELTTLLKNLPEGAEEQAWDERLQTIGNRIQRLGAINLAAIEEYESQSERKVYLDKQMADLQEALNILENAIRKIDKETKQRFKDTYDTVNNKFSELFPKIFGGGRAELELTGDDLLDTGITVMACPPGKRNSTIHLLSGGEKALTALALVFSIFQLNPSPFCMLDEVDAPLDDANIMRFCNLLREMSSQVQFIFISHNKITIEMAEHMVGVTMKEPGVSRLVSVDMEQAIAMAEA